MSIFLLEHVWLFEYLSFSLEQELVAKDAADAAAAREKEVLHQNWKLKNKVMEKKVPDNFSLIAHPFQSVSLIQLPSISIQFFGTFLLSLWLFFFRHETVTSRDEMGEEVVLELAWCEKHLLLK